MIENYDTGVLELYDLARDPSETADLASKQVALSKLLHAKLVAWRRSVDAQENTPNPNFDAELFKKVYLDMDVSRVRAGKNSLETSAPLAGWNRLMKPNVAPATVDWPADQ